MDIHMFDNLPVRVISANETVLEEWLRPSEERLKHAEQEHENLPDALFHVRTQMTLEIEYEGSPFYVDVADSHFAQFGYRVTNTYLHLKGGRLTLRKVTSQEQ